jgi:hypothetical protein
MPDETERLARMLAEANGWTWAGMSVKLRESYRREAGWLLARGVTLAPAPAPAASPALRAAAEAFKDCWHDANGEPGAYWRHGEADEYARRVVRAWLEGKEQEARARTLIFDHEGKTIYVYADELAALRRDLGER